MFGGTIWALSSQRSTFRVNRKMLAVACSLLLFSTVVCVFVRHPGCGSTHRVYAAPRDRYHKGRGGFYLSSSHIPRGTYPLFFGGIAMDVRDQELRVCCADTSRGRRRCELTLGPEESHPLTPVSALPLLCGMAI